MMSSTRPYYRSSYVFVTRADRGLHIASLAGTWLAVVAGFGVALQPTVLATLGVSAAVLHPGLSLGTFVAASIAVGQFAASAGMLQGAVVSSFSLLSAYRRLRPVLAGRRALRFLPVLGSFPGGPSGPRTAAPVLAARQ